MHVMYQSVIRFLQGIPTAFKVSLFATATALVLVDQMASPSNTENDNVSTQRIPSAFIPHGGGPLPILGDKEHKSMVTWLNSFAGTYLSKNKPKACLVISAHWEAPVATIQTGETTDLYYDYYGFPKEAYNLKYKIPPAGELSKRVAELLEKANIPHAVDSKRGYDHGVFIPMKLIYPNAEVPTIQMSLVAGLDPMTHIRIGEALAPLREEGVFILGSGMSYHNMQGFRDPRADEDSIPFHKYLRDAVGDDGKSYEEKALKLKEWTKAPRARANHPREEHLIPLMVLLGTSKNSGGKAKEAYFDNVAGVKCAGYIFE